MLDADICDWFTILKWLKLLRIQNQSGQKILSLTFMRIVKT